MSAAVSVSDAARGVLVGLCATHSSPLMTSNATTDCICCYPGQHWLVSDRASGTVLFSWHSVSVVEQASLLLHRAPDGDTSDSIACGRDLHSWQAGVDNGFDCAQPSTVDSPL
jgi:hypothetical protein